MFATHQSRLPKELAAQGIITMAGANRYLTEDYRAAFNEEFTVPAAAPGSAFVPFIGPGLADIMCEHHERTVGRDHCMSFERRRLHIPAPARRYHFVKARARGLPACCPCGHAWTTVENADRATKYSQPGTPELSGTLFSSRLINQLSPR